MDTHLHVVLCYELLGPVRAQGHTPEEAVTLVTSGNRVWFGEGCGTPKPLIDALMRRAGELHDVELVHMLTFGDAPYTRPEYEGHFRHNACSWAEMSAKLFKKAAPITRPSS